MADYRRMEEQLTEALGLRRRPVAVAFRDAAPAGVMKFSGSEPSGCSFWRVAASGRSFYTVAGDHYNCPIGSYTHNLALPPERIVFDHVSGPKFRLTATLAEGEGKTRLVFRMLFETAAECAKVKGFASAANEQNFDRLEAHLAGTA